MAAVMVVDVNIDARATFANLLTDSPARLFVPQRERVYITARACELELCGTKGLQAAGAGQQLRASPSLAN